MIVQIHLAESDLLINHSDRYISTTFPDGRQAEARPNWTPTDIERATDLGYQGDCWQMCIDHELLHTFVGELYGFRHSVILWHVAHDNPKRWPKWGKEEEGFVTSLQRHIQTGAVDALVWGLRIQALSSNGWDQDELRLYIDRLLSAARAEL